MLKRYMHRIIYILVAILLFNTVYLSAQALLMLDMNKMWRSWEPYEKSISFVSNEGSMTVDDFLEKVTSHNLNAFQIQGDASSDVLTVLYHLRNNVYTDKFHLNQEIDYENFNKLSYFITSDTSQEYYLTSSVEVADVRIGSALVHANSIIGSWTFTTDDASNFDTFLRSIQGTGLLYSENISVDTENAFSPTRILIATVATLFSNPFSLLSILILLGVISFSIYQGRRDLSVYRIMGYRKRDVYLDFIATYVSELTVIYFTVMALLYLFFVSNLGLLGIFVMVSFLVFLLLVILLSFLFLIWTLYYHRIKIKDVLKYQQNDRSIVFVLQVVKYIATYFMVGLILLGVQSYIRTTNLRNNYEQIEAINHDRRALVMSQSILSSVDYFEVGNEIYTLLDDQGLLFVNYSRDYDGESVQFVNTSFLELFDLKDTDNQDIALRHDVPTIIVTSGKVEILNDLLQNNLDLNINLNINPDLKVVHIVEVSPQTIYPKIDVNREANIQLDQFIMVLDTDISPSIYGSSFVHASDSERVKELVGTVIDSDSFEMVPLINSLDEQIEIVNAQQASYASQLAIYCVFFMLITTSIYHVINQMLMREFIVKRFMGYKVRDLNAPILALQLTITMVALVHWTLRHNFKNVYVVVIVLGVMMLFEILIFALINYRTNTKILNVALKGGI